MSSPLENPVIPKGSTVLITGANGLIGSHIADQFLKFGYKVRGVVRDPQKHAYLSSLFDRKYGSNLFELVGIPGVEVEGAFKDVIKGVSAVVHTASNLSLDPDPNNVVPEAIAGVTNLLTAAAEEPSVKRFVLTSSSTAAILPKPNNPVTVTVDTWNDELVSFVYDNPPKPENAYAVYGASKTLQEKAAWDFVRNKQPEFVLNSVLPDFNSGLSLDPVNQGHPSTSGMVATLFHGDTGFLKFLPAQYFVDVQDDALLHVAAAIHPGVESERIFAFAGPVNGDDLLAVLRKLYPGRTFPANFQDAKDLSEIVPRARAEALLRDMGKDGWTSLEESVRLNTEDLV